MQKVISSRSNGRKRVQLKSDKPSKTETSHTKQVNINSIMKKYFKTGLLQQREGARYGDFTTVTDYQEAVDRVLQANDQFMELPSEIRTMFSNDPGILIDFVNNPANKQKAQDLGLLPPDGPRFGQDGQTPTGGVVSTDGNNAPPESNPANAGETPSTP